MKPVHTCEVQHCKIINVNLKHKGFILYRAMVKGIAQYQNIQFKNTVSLQAGQHNLN